MKKPDRYALAKAGKIDALMKSFDLSALEGADEEEDEDGGGGGEEHVVEAWQWLRVAAELGSKDADDRADGLLSAFLERYGDETIALAHFELGRWWLLGEEGVVRDPARGFEELSHAAKLGVRSLIDLESELSALRKKLAAADRPRFEALFPPKRKKGSAKP